MANHLVKALAEDLAGTAPITLPEYVVLVHLSEAEAQQLRIGDLAAISAVSPSRMSRLVDEMVAKGRLTKTRLPEDGRSTAAKLTPAGLSILQKSYPTQLRNIRRRVFDLLTEDDVHALSTALPKIRKGLEFTDPETDPETAA